MSEATQAVTATPPKMTIRFPKLVLGDRCWDNDMRQPKKGEAHVLCRVPLILGEQVSVQAIGHDLYAYGGVARFNEPWKMQVEDQPFVQVEVVGKAEPRDLPYEWYPRGYGSGEKRVEMKRDTYVVGYQPAYYTQRRHGFFGFHDREKYEIRTDYAFLRVRVTAADGTVVEGDLKFQMPDAGLVTCKCDSILSIHTDFYGMIRDWTEDLHLAVDDEDLRYEKGDKDAARRRKQRGHAWDIVRRHLTESEIVGGPDALWDFFLKLVVDPSKVNTDGVKAVENSKAVKPNIERLRVEAPLDWLYFQWLHDGQVRNRISNNVMLAAFLKEVGGDFGTLLAALRENRSKAHLGVRGYYRDREEDAGDGEARSACIGLPGVEGLIGEKKAKRDWTQRKANEDKAEGAGIDPTLFPKLHAAVVEGKIPATVFYQPDTKQAVNVEFLLWEKALARKGWADVLFEIAQNAASRSTYERDITPFINFLFRLEVYLKRTTGQKWTTMPKFVQSQWELEMRASEDDGEGGEDEDDKKGPTKRRSAFTPVADNQTHVVTVPYVAVCVTGVRTQWCYARHFYLFEEGFTDPESGGIVLGDYEKALNGRDDYGLCYYTLTGTVTARGYPTFLIIHERLSTGTRIHFHRVHPSRSKDGKKTPACQMVANCYRYMAGNVRAEEIHAQQGDLIFIRCPDQTGLDKGQKVKDPVDVNEYESHRFETGNGTAVKLYESTAKEPKNRLGFIFAPSGFAVRHPEHEDIEHLPEGWYEIRQCRSWESNPRAVWSLRID